MGIGWRHIKAFTAKVIDPHDSNVESFITATAITAEEKLGLDIVSHAHGGTGMVHYFKSGITATERAVLVDLSDTVNYPHTGTVTVHMAWFNFDIDPSSDADYVLQIGFVTNVDATNGDFHEMFKVSGTRKAGNAKGGFFPMSPQGPAASAAKIVTSVKSLNDVAFQTDVDLYSTLDPNTADTPSGNGDIVYILTMNAGTVNLGIELSYHGHTV